MINRTTAHTKNAHFKRKMTVEISGKPHFQIEYTCTCTKNPHAKLWFKSASQWNFSSFSTFFRNLNLFCLFSSFFGYLILLWVIVLCRIIFSSCLFFSFVCYVIILNKSMPTNYLKWNKITNTNFCTLFIWNCWTEGALISWFHITVRWFERNVENLKIYVGKNGIEEGIKLHAWNKVIKPEKYSQPSES